MCKFLTLIVLTLTIGQVISVSEGDCTVVTCTDSINENNCASIKKNTNGDGHVINFNQCPDDSYCIDAYSLASADINNLESTFSSDKTFKCKAMPTVSDIDSELESELEDLESDLSDLDIKESDLSELEDELKEMNSYCTEQMPGEKCSNDIHCYGSSKCNNGICSGKGEGEECEEMEECDKGLYCDSAEAKCRKQIGLNQTCNILHIGFDCQNDLICGSESKCIPYYSKKFGENALMYNFECESGMAKEGDVFYICDTATLSEESCTGSSDTCLWKYKDGSMIKTDEGKENHECVCDETSRSNKRSCEDLVTKFTIYKDVHTYLRLFGTLKCDNNGGEFDDACINKSIYNDDSSYFMRVSFALGFAALFVLF